MSWGGMLSVQSISPVLEVPCTAVVALGDELEHDRLPIVWRALPQ